MRDSVPNNDAKRNHATKGTVDMVSQKAHEATASLQGPLRDLASTSASDPKTFTRTYRYDYEPGLAKDVLHCPLKGSGSTKLRIDNDQSDGHRSKVSQIA